MKLKMNEYYRIMHFLKDATVDRLYPCEDYFYEENEEVNYHKSLILEIHSYLTLIAKPL